MEKGNEKLTQSDSEPKTTQPKKYRHKRGKAALARRTEKRKKKLNDKINSQGANQEAEETTPGSSRPQDTPSQLCGETSTNRNGSGAPIDETVGEQPHHPFIRQTHEYYQDILQRMNAGYDALRQEVMQLRQNAVRFDPAPALSEDEKSLTDEKSEVVKNATLGSDAAEQAVHEDTLG